jgi:RNA polymerase sigma factor (sigma-70 family)
MNDEPPGVRAPDPGDEPLQALVDGLNRGDEEALERAFRAYAPYLRMVVRRQLSARLRVRFDTSDVIQSIWADLLPGFRGGGWRFADAARLRSFLVRATRNRLIDRQRRHGPELGRERSIARGDVQVLPAPEADRPSRQVLAGELWERMLAACPPAHREVLVLKREGLTSAEIAARVGLHEGSVRRILCDLARRLGVAARAGAPAARRPPGEES